MSEVMKSAAVLVNPHKLDKNGKPLPGGGAVAGLQV
jgi:hypothetical protein